MFKSNQTLQSITSSLRESFQALKAMTDTKFDQVKGQKKKFEQITLCFEKMKGLNNDHLPEYVSLMRQLVEFLHAPQYINFYRNCDKMLTQNLVKSCVVEPFKNKFMTPRPEGGFELSRFASHPNLLEDVNKIFIELLEFNLLTDKLMIILKQGLNDYITFIDQNKVIKERFGQITMTQLRILLIKCNLADDDAIFNQSNKKQLTELFKNKKASNMSQKYLQELCLINKEFSKEKKYLKKIFSDKKSYYHFVRDIILWILEKFKYDFSKEEVQEFLEYLRKISKNNHSLMSSSQKKQSPSRLHLFKEASPPIDDSIRHDFHFSNNDNEISSDKLAFTLKQHSLKRLNDDSLDNINKSFQLPKFIKFVEEQSKNDISHIANSVRSENVVETQRSSPQNKSAIKIIMNNSYLCSPSGTENSNKVFFNNTLSLNQRSQQKPLIRAMTTKNNRNQTGSFLPIQSPEKNTKNMLDEKVKFFKRITTDESRVISQASAKDGTNKPNTDILNRVRSTSYEPGRNVMRINGNVTANQVYRTGNLHIQNFITNNKSKIDQTQTQYMLETSSFSIQDLLMQKGTKCICQGSSYKKALQNNQKHYFEEQKFHKVDRLNLSYQQSSQKSKKSQEVCGDLCKYLQSDQQRNIIHKIMLKENGTLNNKANSGKVGDKKYLVNALWWRQWCDYVNFDQTDFSSSSLNGSNKQFNITQIIPNNQQNFIESKQQSQNKFASRKMILANESSQPISKIQQTEESVPSESARQRQDRFRAELMNLKKSKSRERERASSDYREHPVVPLPQNTLRESLNIQQNQYEKPGIIQNQDLLKNGRSMHLKDNIVEHFDYEAVPALVWKYLYSWYSADWCIMRQMKKDRVNAFGVFLDLYPELNPYVTDDNIIDDFDNSDNGSNDSLERMMLSIPELSKNKIS
ncbi:ubiquitin carboxyl-terminal hydrolase 32 [Stylonychia lemnae]|uniref:Ubiquitin carboxyl-terminal hydrolase 32 n=1 Tax=Stylonychia lemnae TaxID=5949 RepID=A0A078B3J3_STYLE|nr:ubiquitin carboxyl-terminal hydrolase 32 [Stylonychia lemnae]|eukprot:CDW89100.1 ubiquitin carboxyl-terminal hydrolase 32 [Stylonychia lemnae]